MSEMTNETQFRKQASLGWVLPRISLVSESAALSVGVHCASREITSQFLPQNDASMEAPLGCAMRPESPLMPGRSETPRPKPAAFIPRVHELAMPSRASTPLAAGCLLGSVRALLITGLPSAHSRIYHAWPGRTPA